MSAKSASTIDLMKTANGYSLVQNDTLINKIANPVINQINPVLNATTKYIKQKAVIPVKKFITQQNFTIYPYIYDKELENHKYVIIPSRTQWFNLNQVHEIQKKSLPQWFKQKKVAMASLNLLKFEKNEELYKKYRNHIIQLGKSQYVSPLQARKGLAGDACSIIRIHSFLQKWGLVNYVHKKNQIKITNDKKEDYSQQNNESHVRRKDGFDRDKSNITKSYDKDDLQLLKKITKKFRPICTSCEDICGVAWYQYCQKLQFKIFHFNQQMNQSDVQSGQVFQYKLRVCFACYAEKNFPVVLSFQDFTKKSILNNISFIDFDKKYKKKANEFAKISEVIEKNKFNILKSSQNLKASQSELFDTLMQMPICNLEKISRVQPETQDQEHMTTETKQNLNVEKDGKLCRQKDQRDESEDKQDLKKFEENIKNVEFEQRKIYEQFLQAWLLKIYTKMEHLQEWDKSIQWKLLENESVKKHNLAQKLKNSLRF